MFTGAAVLLAVLAVATEMRALTDSRSHTRQSYPYSVLSVSGHCISNVSHSVLRNPL